MTTLAERLDADPQAEPNPAAANWESNDVAPEIEPTASETPIDAATSRVGRFMQRLADRIENGAGHADTASEFVGETKEKAKAKVRGIGRVAARFGAAGGEFVVGAGLLAANKGLELADKADDAVLNAVDSAKQGIKNGYNTAADRTGDAIMNGFAKVEAGADKVGEKMVSFKEGVKEKLIAKKESALARRKARRERWSNRRDAVKSAMNSGIDTVVSTAASVGNTVKSGVDYATDTALLAREYATDKAERTRVSVHTTRAAGRAALSAFNETRRVHVEQNGL